MKRIEKKFFNRNTEIQLIPITQDDNDNMIKLLIEIDIKMSKHVRRSKKLKIYLKQKRELYKIRSDIFWTNMKKVIPIKTSIKAYKLVIKV